MAVRGTGVIRDAILSQEWPAKPTLNLLLGQGLDYRGRVPERFSHVVEAQVLVVQVPWLCGTPFFRKSAVLQSEKGPGVHWEKVAKIQILLFLP